MTKEIVYVQPATLLRLISSERAQRREDGVAFFRLDDHRFPGRPLMVAAEVTENAAHERCWSPFERKFVFQYVADV